MSYPPLVSIIIVTLNRKTELLNCVKSIYAQKYKNLELIIIDNGSTDGTSSVLKKKFPKARIFKTNKNLGTSYTRNAGVNFSKGKIIWFLDSDTYLINGNTLSNLIQKFLKIKKIDAIGGEGILKNKKIIGSKILKLHPNGMTKSFFNQNIDKTKIKISATSNLMIKKNVFLNIGGFDHFYFFYLEDIDLTYRVYKKGYNMYSFSDISVIHYFSKKTRFKNHFSAKRNRIYFLIKNFSIINILLLPIYDMIYLLSFDNFKRFFLNQLIFNTKTKKIDKKLIRIFSIQNSIKLFCNLVIVIFSMLFSYLYIPLYLLRYFHNKEKKINYLKFINSKNFVEVFD